MARLFRLRDAGLDILTTEWTPTAEGWAFLCDYRVIVAQDEGSEASFVRLESGEENFIERRARFLEAVKRSSDFEPDQEPFSIRLEAEAAAVREGEQTRVHWRIDGAQNAVFDGLGEVGQSGSTPILVNKDTVLVMRATNKGRIRRKALLINALSEIRIDYQLDYLNPATGGYYDLKEASIGDVYGVSAQTQVRLKWKASPAARVSIAPFGLSGHSGEHSFVPTDSMEISIQARLKDGTESRQRILLRTFPVEVFQNRFIAPDARFFPPVRITVGEHRTRAAAWLEERGWMDHSGAADRLRNRTIQEHKRLSDMLKASAFGRWYERMSVDRVNAFIKERLSKSHD